MDTSCVMFSDEQKTFITKFGLNGTFFAFFVNGCGSRDSGSGSRMSDVEDVNKYAAYIYLKQTDSHKVVSSYVCR